jgi:serine phosphatase RsbU (regulator of sigma subunit)
LFDKSQLGFIALTTLVGLFIIIQAIRKKKDNAWIIGTGVILFVLFVMALFVVGILGENINSIVGIILFFIGLVSLPMTMSIYLARSIATTNKNLQKQLIAVKELSQKELEQKLRAQKAEAENERKTKELEEARSLQLSMLPKVLPQLPNLDIAVYIKTATEVGGDYYDFIVGLDGILTVAIGDATGHGMKAGTIVSMTKALFASGGSNLDMKTYFNQSSDALKGIELGRLMMAFMMIKIKSNKIEIANAGMPPLYIYRKQSKAIEEILIKGMPLGAIKDFPYEIREAEINSGDTLLLLSDGLPELQNEMNEHYGYNRVKEAFAKAAEKEPEEIINYFKNESSNWVNSKDPDDDVTFVVIKIK